MSQSNQMTKRQATLYDAVAGRVSSTGFIPQTPRISAYRDTPSSSTVAVPPEEVLFRRKGAPIRYEEDDFYWADRNLTDDQKLPESDLLKAIHAYASDFYGRAVKGRGKVDFESLDETALLAAGILLEEMARDALGKTGHLAFVEGEDDGVTGAEDVIPLEETSSSGEEKPGSSITASEGDLLEETSSSGEENPRSSIAASEVDHSEETTSSGEEKSGSSTTASGSTSEASTSDRESSGGDKRRRKRRKIRHDDSDG